MYARSGLTDISKLFDHREQQADVVTWTEG